MKLVVPRMSNGVPATTAIKSPRRTSFSSSSRFSATAVSASMLRTRGMLRGSTPQYKLIRRRASRFGEKPTMSAWGRYLEPRRAGAGNDLFLHHRHVFYTHLHAQIPARDHHRVGYSQNGIEVFDRLRLFQFGDDRRILARAGHGGLGGQHVFGLANEADGDVVRPVAERKGEVFAVLRRQGRHVELYAGQIDALVLAQLSAVDDLGGNSVAAHGQHAQLN